jgi:6-phosphogluconolactonase
VELGVGRDVRVYPDLATETLAAARQIVARARQAVRARGVFSWVLAGGGTPRGLYRLLARRYRRSFPWSATEVYFGDERCVPPRHRDSNYAMARDTLLAHVPISRRRVHRLRGEIRPLSSAAGRYARLIGRVPPPADPAHARFDLVLLGVGGDGHTASLFPEARSLREHRRTVVSVRRSPEPPYVPRLTLTLPALNSSREVCFLVSGPEKAAAVAAIFRSGPDGTAHLPASLVRPAGDTIWFLDRAAAHDLPPGVGAPKAR